MPRANRPRRHAAWVLVPLLVGSFSDALAESPDVPGGRLAIVELSTPPTMIGLGAQVVEQVDSAARQQGFSVVSPAEVQQALGSGPYDDVRKCAGAPTCVASRLSRMGAAWAVVGSLDRDEKAYLLRLYLVDVRTARVVASVDRSTLIASRRLRADVDESLPRLLQGQKEALGTLEVTSNVKGAQVWIDGVPAGDTPLTVELKPGRYEVRVEKAHHLTIGRLVDVEAEKVNQDDFRLLLAPGQTDTEPAAAVAAKGEVAPPSGGFRVPTSAWVAFGAGAVAGATGAWLGVRSQQLSHELESGFDARRNEYAGTRATALEGQQMARTANLLFGLAGAALATGVVFTLFDHDDGATSLGTTTVVGPGGASVQLGGHF